LVGHLKLPTIGGLLRAGMQARYGRSVT